MLRIGSRNGWPVFASLLFTYFLLICSCSGHAPELAAVEYRLALVPQDPACKRVSERLSVFAAASDEDGFKDLAALHILMDKNELLWTVGPDTWARGEQTRDIWIGATGLSTPQGGPLPRGLYRVVLEDLSGESDGASFSLGSGVENGAAFPVVRISPEGVLVSTSYPNTVLLFLNEKGAVLRAVDAPRQATQLERLYGPSWHPEVASLLAYAFDPNRNIGIYSWPLKMKP